MSWHYLPGQQAESWGLTSSGSEPCAPLKSNPSHGRCCSDDRKMDAYRGSLCGTTSLHLTDDHGEGVLTSLPADSLARISAQPERVQESQEAAPVYGLTWPELSVKFDPASSSWRIAPCLFPEDSIQSSVTLPRWGMMRCGELLELMMPVHLTVESAPGLWPTPTTRDHKDGEAPYYREGKMQLDTLGRRVRNGGQQTRRTWPTATAQEGRYSGEYGSPGWAAGVAKNHLGNVVQVPGAGALNPDWVEWLMGWPIGWTALKPLETARFQAWFDSHGIR